jgi:hypothetical protein
MNPWRVALGLKRRFAAGHKPKLYRIPSMLLVAPPGPICGALFEFPTELESLEQPARSTRDATSSNIRTTGSFFCNLSFVGKMTDECLYWPRQ